jgi:hypothetical protein
MCGNLGPVLEASAGERKHVDQLVGATGDVVDAEKGIGLVVAVRTDAAPLTTSTELSTGSSKTSSPSRSRSALRGEREEHARCR